MVHVKDELVRGTLLSYRPEIKVLDCTIRDGGLLNDHGFEDKVVEAVYTACVAAGIDYMELGYKASKKIFARSDFGAWKLCDKDDIRRIVDDNPTDLKLSVMADAERTDYHEDILPRDQSVIDAIRVACYVHQIPTALDMVKDAYDKGYEVILQLMAVSVINEADLAEALEAMAGTSVTAIYLVDSFGSLYSEQVKDLTLTYLKAIEGTGKEVGIHAHNNQQLAFANTIESCMLGANRLDSTFFGMGRGAGNCPAELLLGFLKNPKFHVRPVLECIQKHFVPLFEKLGWGYYIPYGITGQLNQHPRPAIKMKAGDNPHDYVSFYDQMIEED